MPLELFQYIAAAIAAGGDGQNLEQARYRGTSAPGVFQLAVVGGLGIEKFEAQEGAHALVQRLLINHGRQLRLRVGPWFGE